jgi:peroxiredoxin
MPLLQARARNLETQGLSVIGVNFDEAATVVRAFQDELELSFPLLLDPGGHINALYRVLAYPTTFFVDAAGVIRFQHLGVMDEGQLDSYLDRMGLG